ncbi:hypothetical protein RF55_16027 [Lasius niger]|uniref:Uncharacterized protein n=1 Tax=Lasius niger TaxID=67767 RepID=A0A0J7MYC9_LASNI|nr:hypothetical protein RF55_16027 [Lasius niger]
MDKLKKTRTAIRAAFTRIFSLLSQLLEKENVDPVELRSRFAVLKDKACELEELDQQILRLMQDSEETSEDMIKEIENVDEYRIRYQRMKVRVNYIVETTSQHPQQVNKSQNAVSMNPYTQNKRFKLPKIELHKFSCDLKEWLQF